MEETPVNTASPLGTFEYMLQFIAQFVSDYGFGTTISALLIAAIIWKSKEIKTILSNSERSMYYEERVKQLELELTAERLDKEKLREKIEHDLEVERKRCDEHIESLRADYEQKLEELRSAFLELSTSTAEKIAKLSTSLERNMQKSRGK